MTSIFLRGFRAVFFSGATASVFLAVSSAQAQSGSENASLFGTFGQGNSAIVDVSGQSVANMACVPTAIVNGLDYLQNYESSIGNTGPLTTAPGYSDINELINSSFMDTTASGTGIGDAANGLASYIGATGPNPGPGMAIYGQYTTLGTFAPASWYTGIPAPAFANQTPSASFLADALNANDAVEFTVVWGSRSANGTYLVNGGGHELTLQSINLANNSISFFDPWGNSQITATATNAGTSAVLYTANLSVQSGFLTVTYPTNGPAATMEPDPNEEGSNDPGDANGQIGYIVADMVETVPEPAPLSVAGTAIVTCLGWSLLRRKLIRNRS